MICAIHQPNFFPWLGYFRKIAQADIFVFLDDVKFSRGSWINRVRILIGGKAHWATVPVKGAHHSQSIEKVEIDRSKHWQRKMVQTLELNYRKSAYYETLMPWVRSMILRQEPNLSVYNTKNIGEIAAKLKLSPRFYRQTELKTSENSDAQGSDRLAILCHQVGADFYLAGDGADSYEDSSSYAERGIKLIKNQFVSPFYPQIGIGGHVPGLSILDALFNAGPEKVSEWLKEDKQ